MPFVVDALAPALGPIGNFVTCISGPAGSGKTTLGLQIATAALQAGEQVVFIDAHSGLSMERLQQMVHRTDALKRFLVRKVYNFQEQDTMIARLPEVMEDFGLVIVDSLGGFYRASTIEEASKRQLELQMRVLVEIARYVPVVVTNQVFEDLKARQQRMIAEEIIGFWAEKKVRLSTRPFRMRVVDGEGEREAPYTIAAGGLELAQ